MPALAIVRELKQDGAYEALFARGRRLMQALEKHLGNAGVPVQILGEPPAFQPWFSDHEIVDQAQRAEQQARHEIERREHVTDSRHGQGLRRQRHPVVAQKPHQADRQIR